jgi:NADH dehydrogenase
MGMRVSGLAAWFLWRAIYLMKMPGLNRKFRISLDWLTAFLFAPDLVQMKVPRGMTIVRQHFEPGEIVFNEGDLGDNVYVIEKGKCEVLKNIDGRPERVAELGTGDDFGEMAVLADVSRNATIRTVTAMDVLLIPKNDFNLLRASVPAFGSVFQELAERRGAAATETR